MYAVVVPGFSTICKTWAEVERIKALYFYPKWKVCNTEEEAHEFIRRYSMRHFVEGVYNYGDTFENLYVTASYKIGPDCVFYKLNTKLIGNLRLTINDANTLIEYHGDTIYIRVNNIHLSDETITSHLSAIYNLLTFLGDCVDVNLILPNFSIYYALTSYKGNKVRAISVVQELVAKKQCSVAYTLQDIN